MSTLFNRPWRLAAIAVPFLLQACVQTAEVEYPERGISYDTTIHELDSQFQTGHFSTVHFGFDLDTLDAEAIARLDEQAEWISAFPNIRFTVTGHTDLMGNKDYNMALGLRRANAVLDYLVSTGVDRARLLAMVSDGEENPIENVAWPERLNRRVTTAVLMPDTAVAGVPEEDNDEPRGRPDPEGEDPEGEDPNQEPEGEDPEGENPEGEDPNAAPEPDGEGDPDEGCTDPNGCDDGEEVQDPAPEGEGECEKTNAGRGNGDENCDEDPGNSEGRNQGGDETGDDWVPPGQA